MSLIVALKPVEEAAAADGAAAAETAETAAMDGKATAVAVGGAGTDVDAACPAMWRDASGAVAAPHAPSFDEPGLSLVFKRLYAPYCEVQFLFEERLGAQLLAAFDEHAGSTASVTSSGGHTGSASNTTLHDTGNNRANDV